MKSNKKPGNTRVQKYSNDYHKRNHILAWIISIVAVLAVGALAYFGYVYFKTKNAFDQTYDSKTKVSIKKGEFNGKKKFAVLLMGTDTGALNRTEKRGRTDTIILAIVNPQKKRYSLISIPRDTMAQMVNPSSSSSSSSSDSSSNKLTVEKINAAYSIGGAKMAMATVSKLINVPVKYYVVINMGGIMKMISYVGGINIRPKLSFEYSGYVFKKDQLTHMGGAGALAYSRMRYDDPQGDYGRQARQRQVIVALIKKAISVGSLTNLDSILTSFSGNVKTNLTFSALQLIALNYRACAKIVKSGYLHGVGVYIDGASYQVPPTYELQRISDYCRSELGLAKETISNNETYQNKKNIKNGFKFNSTKTQDYTIYDDYTEEGDN